ncbi:hypothetical protein TorRG33x02_026400 [Trema orientale]|uniref:Uncharacterized protein n=1 Tax=Trema orientale TaxID=63057 RepID=A0A2P5FVN2_TREOI|nr:hypothetical protein TorRG33x02_026400 [Trema orientale]
MKIDNINNGPERVTGSVAIFTNSGHTQDPAPMQIHPLLNGAVKKPSRLIGPTLSRYSRSVKPPSSEPQAHLQRRPVLSFSSP